jgi:hypothetical protein
MIKNKLLINIKITNQNYYRSSNLIYWELNEILTTFINIKLFPNLAHILKIDKKQI